MKKHAYLVSYSARGENKELFYGNMTFTSNKKVKKENTQNIRDEIVRTNQGEPLQPESVIIMSIFYFGKEVCHD